MLDHYHAPAERAPRETDLFRAVDDHVVLFAYDGSEQAKTSILEAAHRLGTDRCAIVLTVWEPRWALPFANAARLAPTDLERGIEETAKRVAYEGARLARSIGFDARPVAASGDPVWRSIVGSAEAHDASIVVLGSRGSAGAALTLKGGVAAAVAHHTQRPVLIVEAASEERAASAVLIVHAPAEATPAQALR